MPLIRTTTEYGTKYNRHLWDDATRKNYFSLAEDRKQRMLRAATHAPIYWDQDRDKELVINNCLRSEPPSNRRKGKIAQHPPIPRDAWGTVDDRTESEASSFEHLEMEHYPETDQSTKLKRTKEQLSPSPDYLTDRKRLRTPGSECESTDHRSPLNRLQCTSNSPFIANDYSRPYTGPTVRSVISQLSNLTKSSDAYRMGLDDKTHTETVKRRPTSSPAKTARHAASATEFRSASGSRRVYDPPRCFTEKDQLKMMFGDRPKFKRASADKFKDMKHISRELQMGDLPKDMRSWVTEYQGNFKGNNALF